MNDYPFLPLSVVEKFVPLAEQRGVSEVARSERGFLTQYRRHGKNLDPWWANRRINFNKRHMAQLVLHGEPLFEADGTPTRRHLALIMWAFSPVPDQLTSSRTKRPGRGKVRSNPIDLSELPAAPGSEAVMPLPEWWSEQSVYHGTSARVWRAIQDEGFCCPPAFDCSDGGEYGWDAVWKHETYAAYKSLTREQRRVFHRHVGHTGRSLVPMRALGYGVSLFWVSLSQRVAESYGVVTEVDLSLLRYYFWFEDEILGEQSYVFVMPMDCPQAPTSILTRVEYDPEPVSRYGYVSLRNYALVGSQPDVWAHGLVEGVGPDEVLFSATPDTGAGEPVARFPWPSDTRLVDARRNFYATSQPLLPDESWEVNYSRYVNHYYDESKWQPLPSTRDELLARWKAYP